MHRAVPLDFVGVKRFDADGAVVGEQRFFGLYTATVYSEPTDDAPRRAPQGGGGDRPLRLRAVEPRAARAASTCSRRSRATRCSGSRPIASPCSRSAIVRLGDRRRLRLFVGGDEFGRFVSCLVYLPRDRYTTEVRVAILDALQRAFDGSDVDFTVLVERRGARASARRGADAGRRRAGRRRSRARVRARGARARVADELRDALVAARGEEAGVDTFRIWRGAFPPAYQADVTPEQAVADIAVLEAGDDLAIRLQGAARR